MLSPLIGIIASSGGVAVPPLGTTFTSRTSLPSSANWYDAAWNGTRWAAVAQRSSAAATNKAAYSTDGITWTATTMSASNLWQAVSWDSSNSKFVAVTGQTVTSYSSDGITWTAGGTLANVNHIAVASNTSGTSVTIAYTTVGNNVAYTTNGGSSWTQSTIGTSQRLADVAWGNSTFVIILGSSSNNVYTSTNGSSWTLRSGVLPATAGWALGYGTQFVAINYSGTTGATSSDGITWTSRTVPNGTAYQNIAYGGGVYICIEYGTTNAITSTDGITWTSRTLPAALNYINVSAKSDQFIMLPGDSDTNQYVTSP